MTLTANSYAAKDAAYHAHAQTNWRAHEENGALVMERGDGVFVYDETGKEYIEGMSGLWCASLGFSNQRLIDAGSAQLNKLPYYHTFNHKSSTPTAELAEKLISMAPDNMSRVIFNCSGSEAVDTAIKMVRFYHNAIGKPLKKKVIGRINAYHGTTIASASLCGLPPMHNYFDLPMEGVLHTDSPHHYRFCEEGESEEEFATRIANNLEALIVEEGPETIGAMFAEPIIGAGGVIIPPATYFDKIQPILRKYDILLVSDEVICGFGRTGSMWGCQTYDMQPDIITCAKALTASYIPMSATILSDKVYQAIADGSNELGVFSHGFTYGGHPVAAAVGLETLKIYEDMDIVSVVRGLTPAFQKMLHSFQDHPLVGECRGVGMVGAIELVQNKDTKENFNPAAKVGATLAKNGEKHGVIVRAMKGDALAMCPPFIITEEQIGMMKTRLDAAFDDTYKWAKGEGLA
jgi:4-aminobutyrate--pyruvate transaminase